MKDFLLLSSAVLVAATINVTNAQETTTTVLMTPAFEIVTATASSAPTYFANEAIQLTDAALANATKTINNESLSSLFSFGSNSSVSSRAQSGCKFLPGDPFWPMELVWDIFDLLLGGALIKTKPLAAPCYTSRPEYDADACLTLTAAWLYSNLHMTDPTSIMLPLYEGRTCLPSPYNWTDSCLQGAYPTYSVNVSNVAQIQLAINFARNANLRLVVKNTGHDFAGKASGKGALSIWTHWLKSKAFYPSFKGANGYVGPAIKVGSGIQVWEAYEYAKSLDLTVVGGEAVTVGMGGGYIAGGGHSPLSSFYGMGSDQVLALEVVLADGRFITATATQNADVYWMLRGGGGSTIGVVTSLTVKAYPKLQTTTVSFNYTIADVPSVDAFWSAFQAYIDNAEAFVDAGTYGYYYLGASAAGIGTDAPGSTNYYFRMESFVAPNMTIAQTKALLAPYFTTLDSLNITYTPWYNNADNFHDVWVEAFPQEYVGTDVVKTASRLMPRSVFQDDSLRNRTFEAHKDAVAQGLFAAGFHISGAGIAVTPPTDSALLPAWRDTIMHTIIGQTWAFDASWETIYNTSIFVTEWMNVLRDIAPNSGAYMSEGDLIEPNQKVAFHGVNYPRLYALKQKYDPTGLFFALTAVGSEDWEVQVTDPLPYSWNNNGRLCPVSS